MKILYRITLLLMIVTNISGMLVNVALGKKTDQFKAPGDEIWPSSNANDGVKECQNINSTYLTLSGNSHLPWWKLDLGEVFQIHQINIFGRNNTQVNQLQGFRLYLSLSGNFSESNIVYTNRADDYNKGHITVTQNLTGSFQFVKLDLPDTYREISKDGGKLGGPIVLCEVEILVEILNIAFHKNVTMSSHFGNMTADKSVDGDARGDANKCNCCSHSRNETNPWLTVDLLKVYEIFQIRIAGRSDDDRNNRVLTGLEISTNGTNNLVNGSYTAANASDVIVTLPQGLNSRYVTLRRPRPQNLSEWYLVVCEVEIYVRYLDLITPIRANVITSQSSTYSPNGMSQNFDSKKAIDGADNYLIDTCGCCSVTDGDSPSWWQIDLKQEYLIGALQIFGRATGYAKQLQHAIIYAGNVTMSSNISGGLQVYEVPNIINNNSHFTKEIGPVIAQYFIVKLNYGILTLCEFKLFEKVCEIGFFGTGCLHECHCSDYNSCNQVTGKCQTPGCLSGWKGKACESECDHRKFGENCSSVCNCLNNTTCSAQNGICSVGKCDPGWQTARCDEQCHQHNFGNGCNNTCHCKNGTKCDHISGYCDDGLCDPGWLIPTCSKACGHRTFGENCSSVCHCLNNTTCSAQNGICSVGKCDPGWQTARCDELCDDRLFGYNCSSTCHCLNNTKCNSTTGECFIGLCDPGWQASSCDKVCNNREFGYNCSSTCNCLNDTKCNSTTGACHIGLCNPGWKGPSCDQVCDNRTFGYNCSSTCHCLNDSKCNSTTGECYTGLCDSGWQGPSCDKVCDDRAFGYNCSSICHCLNETNCNSTTGECFISLCDPGWQDPACDQVCDNRTFGYNCSSTCHCLNDTSCNSTTGKCDIDICDPGWQSSRCDEECDNRTFGYNCSSSCNCLNGTSCNSITGECSICMCDPGWQGPACDQVCDNRKFGYNCSSTCHCLNDTNCNSITGECYTKLCDSGWKGPRCDQVCSHRQFGFNCSSTCHCNDNSTCKGSTGACKVIGVCDPGWVGPSCSKASPERTDKSSESAAAIGEEAGAAAALVIFGAVIGFIILRRMRSAKKNAGKETTFSHLDKVFEDKRKPQRRTKTQAHVNRSYEDEQETSMNVTLGEDYYSFGEQFMGIKIHELWDYIHDNMENNFEQLVSDFKTLPQGLIYSYKSADHISNRCKNRYREMYAYDHTRVILEDDNKPGEDTQTDYINACYVDGYEKVKKFVASQGPTKNMVDDFWRMIWQLKSEKIVMLTNLIEMGTTKCLLYWPNDDEETKCSFGNYVITLIETEKYLDFNIRVLQVIKNGEESRRIRQFHFKSWPDKDVPDSTWCLVNFWRVVDTNAVTTAGPIIVHCSAGVGRTGTFIALDNMMNQARKEGCVRPLQIVRTLRNQRVNMVQTKEQYVYLHEAVADALYFGTHIIWSRQFCDVVAFMLQKDEDGIQTRLQKQFELIDRSAEDSSSDVAESPEYSNVETIMSESDAYRPKIRNRGSNFVQQLGAIYIPNYKRKSTFLVSMSPNKDTMEEFWSLVDENNIKTIIMLTEQSSSSYQSSCDLGSSSNGGAKLSVKKIEESKRKGYTQRSFTFKESKREEEDYLTSVKQFEYTAWKDGYPAPDDTTSLLDMIDTVLKWQPHLSESQPVLVHCSDGFSRSGIVCVLLNEIQRMKYEGGHINIVESVKMMKKRHRGLIGNYEQYKFCFDLIMDHIKQTDVYQNL